MKKDILLKKEARIAGIFFLVAMVSSLVGGGLLESVIENSDYLKEIANSSGLLEISVLLELINAISVIIIAAMLYSALRLYNKSVGIGYVAIRIMESVVCVLGAIIPLWLLPLSEEFVDAGSTNSVLWETAGTLIKEARADVMDILVPLFFSIGAALLYFTLFKTKLVPRFISVWGLIGVLGIVLVNTLNFSGINASMAIFAALVLPIIANEIFLGVWLISKGFDQEKVRKLASRGG